MYQIFLQFRMAMVVGVKYKLFIYLYIFHQNKSINKKNNHHQQILFFTTLYLFFRCCGDACPLYATWVLVWPCLLPTLLCRGPHLHVHGLLLGQHLSDLVACCALCSLQPSARRSALSWVLPEQVWRLPVTTEGLHSICTVILNLSAFLWSEYECNFATC